MRPTILRSTLLAPSTTPRCHGARSEASDRTAAWLPVQILLVAQILVAITAQERGAKSVLIGNRSLRQAICEPGRVDLALGHGEFHA